MTSTSVSRGDKDVPQTHDLGQRAIRRVFEMCLIDEKWTVWEERGFSWWAKDFRQRVWVEPAIHDDGFEIYRLFAATDFVANTKCSQDDLSQKLCLTGMFASLAASVHTPGDEVVNLLSSMYVHEATFEWVIRFFATATILQVIEAQRLAWHAAAIFNGEPDKSGHPTQGIRVVGDEMLALVENVIAPVGTEPCRWDDENEFEEVAQILNSCNCVASSGGLGLTAEFSFGDEANNVLGTSMLMIQTDQRHPQLGNGLLGRLHLPLSLDNRQTAQIAASLNRFETLSLTKSHLLGSWTLKEMGGGPTPVFVCFMPNFVYERRVLTNIVLSFAQRARWAAEEIEPDTEACDVKAVLCDRLARFKDSSGDGVEDETAA